MKLLNLLLLAGLCSGYPTAAGAADTQRLWEIGTTDRNDAEFALGPKDYAKFRNDGCFIVGRSDARRDWPYVHPGSDDAWAGARPHTFVVVFGIKAALADGECRLRLDWVDTHSGHPPRLRVEVNGRTFEKTMPAGAGDASVFGAPSQGKPYRWEVTFPASLLKAGDNQISITTVKGSWALYDALSLETPMGLALAPVAPHSLIGAVEVRPVHLRAGDRVVQPARVTVMHYADAVAAVIRADGQEVARVELHPGSQQVEVGLPPVSAPTPVKLELVIDGKVAADRQTTTVPLRLKEIWLLPHSHVDIGYTHRQDDVINIQIGNLEKGMELARASATNAPGMRFKWNPEAVWSLDHFLARATPEKRAAFLAAVRQGEVGVDGLYGNLLTGLCRPEELAQGLGFGARLSTLTGVPVESASICDVPGYTWGTVSMMGQAGVKYFAIGPNFGDRVGTIHLWDNQPFYWKSPSAREKLLCWVVDNYHFFGNLEDNALEQIGRLEKSAFPFDTTFLFWVGLWPGGGVDNAPPDELTVEKVVAWNKKYAAPRIVIGLTGEFFREFEKKHGAHLPQFSGDLTPYWEDGAGSTSRETGMNRGSADRLAQADFLWTLLAPRARPGARFDEAWKNVLLYTEHTWGAWCSISKPDDAFTLDQWRVKGQFARDADRQSRELLRDALATRAPASAAATTFIDVYNTTQWPRTDLVTVPEELKFGGEHVRVVDSAGREMPSQLIHSSAGREMTPELTHPGVWVFLAKDVPPFGVKRFRVAAGTAARKGAASVSNLTLIASQLRVTINPRTGAIQSLQKTGLKAELVDAKAPVGLNDYRYVLGADAQGAKGDSEPVTRVLDNGPLVACVQILSSAPGCSNLIREVRVVDGLDRVELTDQVNRQSVRVKDGVHFGFGFNVPRGQIRMETPWAVVRPNLDQLPGSCRNWFTVQRWVDISNPDYGVLWAPLDAPLMEIGGLTANLLGSVAFKDWMTNAIDSQTVYSWAQNNHWHTNYKIDQPGITTFRYMLRPHRGGYAAGNAARFGLETTRPLLAVPANPARPAPGSLFQVSNPEVLVETVKMSADGRAYIVRLFGVSGKDARVKLAWNVPLKGVWLSDLTEQPLRRIPGAIDVPAWAAMTLRAEME